MYDHVCSHLFRVDRQMENVRRTEVDWCHILVTTSTVLLSTSFFPGCQVLAKLVSLLRQNRHLLRTGRTTLRQPTDQNGYCTVSTCVFASVVTCKAWLQTALLCTALWRRSSWTLNFDFFSHSAIQFRTPQNHFPRFCFKSIEFSWDFLDTYSPCFPMRKFGVEPGSQNSLLNPYGEHNLNS